MYTACVAPRGVGRALLLSLVAGCDAPAAPASVRTEPDPPAIAAPTLPVTPSKAEEPPPAPEPGAQSPSPLVPLAELLPRAPAPISLQHARTLAKDGTWAEAAAIYNALVVADPKDARALAGRGFALASWGDPRVVGHARADLDAALAMGPERKLAAAIRFNAGNLEEAVGDRARAAAHYRESTALRPSADASHALARVGGDPKRVFGEGARCEFDGPLRATAARSFSDAVTKIRAVQVDAPKRRKLNDADAQALLCDGACPADAFVAMLGFLDGPSEEEASTEAHLIIPRAKATTWVIPRLAMGNGNAARCPDEIVDITVDDVAGLVRARLTLLVNHLEECDDEVKGCLPGCFWMSRTDYVVWAAPATGEHVVLRSTLTLEEPTAAPWQRLEEQPVLPPGVVHVDETGVHMHGCGITRDVALGVPPP